MSASSLSTVNLLSRSIPQEPSMDELDIITLAEAGALLGRSPTTLRSQVKAGRLRARLIGKTWVTTRVEVERYRRESLGQPGRPATFAQAGVASGTGTAFGAAVVT